MTATADTPVTETVDAPAAFLAARRPTQITTPGVHNISFDDYLRDPVPGGSLSNSEAKHLMPPRGIPARFRWEKDHKRPPKNTFDIGTAAHRMVLGVGPELYVIDADNYRTADAQAMRDDARADGMVPLLAHEYEQILAMATALREHPSASVLFEPGSGLPEQTLVWRDKATGVMRRARLDWLPVVGDGRLIIPDFKTCASVDKHAISTAMNTFGYHTQAATYLDGVRALDIHPAPAFLNVYQEKTPPYLVRIFEPDALALLVARDLNKAALELYAACDAAGQWPGYPDPELVSLPAWVENEYLRETS